VPPSAFLIGEYRKTAIVNAGIASRNLTIEVFISKPRESIDEPKLVYSSSNSDVC